MADTWGVSVASFDGGTGTLAIGGYGFPPYGGLVATEDSLYVLSPGPEAPFTLSVWSPGGPLTTIDSFAVPPPLAADQHNAYAVRLMWVADAGAAMAVASVVAYPDDAGAAVVLASMPAPDASIPIVALAADGTRVYWATANAIVSVPIGGGTPSALACISATAIAVGNNSIFLATGTPGAGRIVRIAKP